jgi:hypothetical protein
LACSRAGPPPPATTPSSPPSCRPPPANRTLVYAFDRCFETALAAGAAPLVGLAAQRAFGFRGTAEPRGERARDLANAAALGDALLTFTVAPWAAVLALYSGLHCTYWRDRLAAARTELEMSPAASLGEAPQRADEEEAEGLLGRRGAAAAAGLSS